MKDRALDSIRRVAGSRRFQAAGKIIYCMAMSLCMLKGVLFIGFTHFTDEAIAVMAPARPVLDVVFCILLTISALLTIPEHRLRGWTGLACAAALLTGLLPGDNSVLVEFIGLSCLSVLIDRRTATRLWLAIHGLYAVVLAVLFFTGIVYDVQMPGNKLPIGIETGHSLGMGHANSMGLLILSTTLGAWYLWKPKKWWATLLLFEAAAAATLLITLSRTNVVLLAVFPVIALVFRILMTNGGEKQRKRITTGSAMLPAVMVLIWLGLSLYVMNAGGRIPGNFWMRFDEIEYIRNKGITLWGTDTVSYTRPLVLDSVYLRTMIMCGAIPLAIILGCYTYMMIRLTRSGEWRLAAIATLYLIYGLMENALLYPFFFFVPMVAFARSEETVQQTFRGTGHLFKNRLLERDQDLIDQNDQQS